MNGKKGGAKGGGGAPGSIPATPLSPKDYFLLILGIVVVGLGMALAMVFLSPLMARTAVLEKFYYIVLIIWGLISAAILRGYARVVLKKHGVFVELGGPAAVFFLVLFVGFKIVPHNHPFNVVVRPHTQEAQVVSSGKIRLEYGVNPAERFIDSTGDADFREIPPEYAGRTVKILPVVEGYKQEYALVTLDPSNPVINLPLTKETPEVRVTGSIVPAPKSKQVKILVEGEKSEAVPDQYGRFEITVHKKSTERARFSVWVNGKQIYDELQPLSGDVKLVLKRSF